MNAIFANTVDLNRDYITPPRKNAKPVQPSPANKRKRVASPPPPTQPRRTSSSHLAKMKVVEEDEEGQDGDASEDDHS